MNIWILLLWICGVCVSANMPVLKRKPLPPKKLPQHAYYYKIAAETQRRASYPRQALRKVGKQNKYGHYHYTYKM
jgi:hypothetical protein